MPTTKPQVALTDVLIQAAYLKGRERATTNALQFLFEQGARIMSAAAMYAGRACSDNVDNWEEMERRIIRTLADTDAGADKE